MGILFDLDGVITDTAEYHFKAWKKLADELGIPFNKQLNEKLKGLSRMDSLELLLGDKRHFFSEEEKLELTNQKNREYLQLLESLSKNDILPGIEVLLKQIRKANIPVGLASASKNAPFVLEKLELTSYFDVVVNPEEVQHGKPAPDLYVKGAELLGIPVQDCIGIEDAVSGIEAVKSAHMFAIGIGDKNTLKMAGADIVLSKTKELTWEVLTSIEK